MRKNLPLKGLAFVLSTTYGFVSASAENIDVFSDHTSNIATNNFASTGHSITRIFDTNFTFSTNGHIDYSGNAQSNLTHDFSATTNFQTLGFNHIQLNFNSINKNFDANLVLITGALDSGNTLTIPRSFTTNVASPYSFDLNSMQPVGSFSLATVDHIVLQMNSGSVSNLAFELASVEAVPEPFSMLTIGAGVAAFVRNRRKKLSKTSA